MSTVIADAAPATVATVNGVPLHAPGEPLSPVVAAPRLR